MHIDTLSHFPSICNINDGSLNLAISRTSDYYLMGLSLRTLTGFL